MPTPLHQRIVFRVSRLLDDEVEARGDGEVFLSPVDLLIREEPLTIRQPDVFLVPASSLPKDLSYRTDRLVCFRPSLAVEVLSPSSHRSEMSRRLRDYASLGIGEIWLLDPDTRTLVVMNLVNGSYVQNHRLGADERIQSSLLPGTQATVGQLFG